MQTCIVYINIAERKNFAKTSIKTRLNPLQKNVKFASALHLIRLTLVLL